MYFIDFKRLSIKCKIYRFLSAVIGIFCDWVEMMKYFFRIIMILVIWPKKNFFGLFWFLFWLVKEFSLLDFVDIEKSWNLIFLCIHYDFLLIFHYFSINSSVVDFRNSRFFFSNFTILIVYLLLMNSLIKDFVQKTSFRQS